MKQILNKYFLTEEQENKIEKYVNFLHQENQKYNLTGFKTIDDIYFGNIIDALEGIFSEEIINNNIIADIGTGCGIPGVILAIKFPEKNFYLVEVIKKRINFLKEILILLDLKNCKIIEYDFKTLVRNNYYNIDCFITRASLTLRDLLFLFSKEFSKYYKKSLVYWGSKNWKDSLNSFELKNLKIKEYEYFIKEKNRFIVDLKNKSI